MRSAREIMALIGGMAATGLPIVEGSRASSPEPPPTPEETKRLSKTESEIIAKAEAKRKMRAEKLKAQALKRTNAVRIPKDADLGEVSNAIGEIKR